MRGELYLKAATLKGCLDLLFQVFTFSDIFVHSQNSGYFPIDIMQWNFASTQPACRSIRCCLRFFIVKLGGVAFHNPVVISAIEFRLFFPGHVPVGLTDHVAGRSESSIIGERTVTTEIVQIPVFPEDALRDVVHHRLEHLLTIAKSFFRLFTLGDIFVHSQNSCHFPINIVHRNFASA